MEDNQNSNETLEILNNYLDKFKDSPTWILLLISVLGGVWQLIQLSLISISYLRLFSISQIIPDGLIITLGLALFGFLIFGLVKLYMLILKKIFLKPNNKLKKWIKKALKWLDSKSSICIVFLITFFIVGVRLLRFYLYDNAYNPFISIFINISIILFISISALFFDLKFKSKIFPNSPIKLSFNLIFTLGFTIICFHFFFFMLSINKLYLIPKHLKNFDNVKTKLVEDNPKAKIEILYFNDKYLFAKIKNENNLKVSKDTIDKIQIIDFEEIPSNP